MMVAARKGRKRRPEDTAGLGDDKMHKAEEELATKALARFKEDAEQLLSLMNPENAVRVFSLLEDRSQLSRDWVAKLKGSPGAPNREDIGAYYDSVGYTQNNETFGAEALSQLTSIFGNIGKDQQISNLVRALKNAKDAGLAEVESKIQKKLDELLDGPAALPAELAVPEENSNEPAVVDELPAGEELVLSP